MKQPDWTAERAELERVADEYRARGYQVVVSPSPLELPDFARDYPPDIVARGESDSVLVEVMNRPSKAERDRIRAIAERVDRQPGWRFVVVSSPLEELGSLPTESLRLPAPAQIERTLAEAAWLKSNGFLEASTLLYWAGVEAAMRLAAKRYGIDMPRPDTWSLMRELVSNGVLPRDLYQRLSNSFRVRSAVAHGFESREQDLEDSISALHQTAQALLFDPEHPLGGPDRSEPGTPS